MDNKQQGWVLLIGLIVYVSWLAFNFNSMVGWMNAGNPAVALLVYYFSNPAYIAFIYFGTKSMGNNFKAFIGSLLLILVFDIVSFPRQAISSIDVSITAVTNSDKIFLGMLQNAGLTYSVAWWSYYLVIPILLIIAVAYLLGLVGFKKTLTNGGA